MFRTETISDFSRLDRWIATTEHLPQQIEAVAQRVHDRNRDPFLAALRVTPRRRSYPGDYPLEWTSERQRKAYWASNGFGKGIPFQRTGSLAKGYVVTLLPTQNGFTINVKNTRRYSEYVVGKLRRRGQNRQQRFHILTGWQSAALVVDEWTRRYREDFTDEWRSLYD